MKQEQIDIALESSQFLLVDSESNQKFHTVVMDLIDSVLSGADLSVNLIQFLRLFAESPIFLPICQLVVNCLWMWGTQTNPSEEVDRWSRLSMLVKDVALSGIIEISLFYTSLELNLLTSSKLVRDIQDEKGLHKRLIKINTGLVYKQQKYNLLREETEGYAKLVVVLSRMPSNHSVLIQYVRSVLSIVGKFELDPNRVLDAVLDAFEQQPTNHLFIHLISQFRESNLTHIIGYKFTHYTHFKPEEYINRQKEASENVTEQSTSNQVDSTDVHYTPSSLYVVAAMLLTYRLIDFYSILPYLRPSITETALFVDYNEEFARTSMLNYSVVSLVGTSSNTNKTTTSSIRKVESAHQLNAQQYNSNKLSTSETISIHNIPSLLLPGSNKPPPPTYPPPVLSIPLKTTSTSTHAMEENFARKGLKEKNVSKNENFEMEVETQDNAVLTIENGLIDKDSGDLLITDDFNMFIENNDDCCNFVSNTEEEIETRAIFIEKKKNDLQKYEQITFGNQIIGLATALITVKNWILARTILNLLQSNNVDAVTHSVELRKSLLAFSLWVISDVYYTVGFKKLHIAADKPKKSTANMDDKWELFPVHDKAKKLIDPEIDKKLETLSDFPNGLYPILSYLGHYVIESSCLFSQTCRLLKRFLESCIGDKNDRLNDDELVDCFRHALQLDDTQALFQSCSDDSFIESKHHEYSNNNNIHKISSKAQKQKDALVLNVKSVVGIIQNCLLPAINCSGANNAFLASQLWQALSILPFQIRFSIYEKWREVGLGKEGICAKNMDVSFAEIRAYHEARSVLKRLTKDNTKQTGRKLSKYTNTNPVVLYTYILNQIEIFDNLIPFIVEALKSSTEFSRDVMAYCLVLQLKKDSEKLKKGDTHYSQWFAALSKFIATYYKRFPNTELKGLFHYLLLRLSGGESLDLLVLKELLCVMGGCETLVDVSAAQLEGLSGGRALRAEVNKSAPSSTKAVRILREELINSGTAMPMLLFIAQIRSRILYDDENSSTSNFSRLKLISHLFDTSQDVLMQFTDFLVAGSSKSIETIATLMPPLNVMLNEIGLAVPVAFQLVRPIIRAALSENEEKMPEYLKAWHPFGDNILTIVTEYVDKDVWKLMSPKLYMVFWSLSLYDINAPEDRYAMESKRLKDRYAELDNKTASSMNPSNTLSSSEMSKLNRQRKTDMTKLLTSIKDLSDEIINQKKHVERMHNLINSQKDFYFSHVDTAFSLDISDSIIQHLLYQRMLMSPLDAVYSTNFFRLLHDVDTPLFSSLHLFDRVMKNFPPLLFCTTETEASFIGYALNDLLCTINTWKNDKINYIDNAANKTGFKKNIIVFKKKETKPLLSDEQESLLSCSDTNATSIVRQQQQRDIIKEESIDAIARHKSVFGNLDMTSAKVSFQEFQEICKSWHSALYNTLMMCLEVGKEYMYVRSALVMLSRIVSQFPSQFVEGELLLHRIDELKTKETERVDLQTMALSLTTILKRQRNQWSGFVATVPVVAPSSSTNDNYSIKEKELLESSSKELFSSKNVKQVVSSTSVAAAAIRGLSSNQTARNTLGSSNALSGGTVISSRLGSSSGGVNASRTSLADMTSKINNNAVESINSDAKQQQRGGSREKELSKEKNKEREKETSAKTKDVAVISSNTKFSKDVNNTSREIVKHAALQSSNNSNSNASSIFKSMKSTSSNLAIAPTLSCMPLATTTTAITTTTTVENVVSKTEHGSLHATDANNAAILLMKSNVTGNKRKINHQTKQQLEDVVNSESKHDIAVDGNTVVSNVKQRNMNNILKEESKNTSIAVAPVETYVGSKTNNMVVENNDAKNNNNNNNSTNNNNTNISNAKSSFESLISKRLRESNELKEKQGSNKTIVVLDEDTTTVNKAANTLTSTTKKIRRNTETNLSTNIVSIKTNEPPTVIDLTTSILPSRQKDNNNQSTDLATATSITTINANNNNNKTNKNVNNAKSKPIKTTVEQNVNNSNVEIADKVVVTSTNTVHNNNNNVQQTTHYDAAATTRYSATIKKNKSKLIEQHQKQDFQTNNALNNTENFRKGQQTMQSQQQPQVFNHSNKNYNMNNNFNNNNNYENNNFNIKNNSNTVRYNIAYNNIQEISSNNILVNNNDNVGNNAGNNLNYHPQQQHHNNKKQQKH